MHYYEFNIKSYHAATAHLTNDEDLAYRRLMDMYYDTEEPIPTALPLLARRLRVGIPELESVLSEFFFLTDKGWEHGYCNEKIEKYHSFIARQKANGSKGGRGKKADAKPDKPTALPDIPSAKPTNNHKPITTNQEPITKENTLGNSVAAPDCPHEEIISLYHEILPVCPSVRVWTDKRKKALRARWREDGKRQSIEWWRKYFSFVSGCDFLVGKTGGDRPFLVDLEWLVNPSNMVKVIEGKYQNAQ